MNKHQLLIIPILFNCFLAFSQPLTSSEILDKSIEFHDPDGIWQNLRAKMVFEESRPNGPSRSTTLEIDNAISLFRLNRNDQEIYEVKENDCLKAEGGDCDRALMMRNYYTYLWGLPMKLKDPGTDLNQTYEEKEINGVGHYVLRVPYEKDTWYFFIRKSDFALTAYQFFQDQEETKGEYIPSEGIFRFENLTIPNTRT